MDLKFFIFLILLSAWPSAQTEPGEDIQFDVADITTQLDYPTSRVTLEAFRVRNTTRNNAPKWVSIGYPMIVKARNGQILEFSPEHIAVKMAVLDDLQKQRLFQKAKRQYPNENVDIENILPLPLVQFACSLTFYLNGTRYEFQGNVYDLRRSPFSLEFPIHEGSSKREALENRLQSHHPLLLRCELAATGKQERVNTLRITGEQMQRMDLADKLIGSADEKFVTRKQLQQLSQEIRSHLHIEEEYEIEIEDFSEEFIYKILENSHAQFEPLPIDEALARLSMYGLRISDRDLAPNEIKRELSDIFHVITEGNKSHIVTGRSQSGSSASHLDASHGTRTMASSDINYAMKQSDSWKKDSSSLNDQLQDINRQSQSGITWEREGTRIIPKSLDVARITKTSLRQRMSFTGIKKRITSEKYYRRYQLSTSASETARESTDPLVQKIMELEQSLQQSISSVTTLIDSKINSAKVTINNVIDNKINNLNINEIQGLKSRLTDLTDRLSKSGSPSPSATCTSHRQILQQQLGLWATFMACPAGKFMTNWNYYYDVGHSKHHMDYICCSLI